jgi:hypothetical protein
MKLHGPLVRRTLAVGPITGDHSCMVRTAVLAVCIVLSSEMEKCFDFWMPGEW